MQLKHIFCAVSLLGSIWSNAQDSQTAVFLELRPQATGLDITSRPTAGYLGIPILGNFRLLMGNSIANPTHWLFQDNQALPTTLNLDAIQQSFSDRNDLSINIEWDWLSVGWFNANRRSFWTMSISENIESSLELPEDLLLLPFTGNASGNVFESGPLDFSSLRLQFSHRREFAATWQYQWNGKWSTGFRLAYLQGLAFAGTRDNTLQWMVNPDNYAWKVQGGMGLDVAGLSNLQGDEHGQVSGYLNQKGNNGISADIAIRFKASERFNGFAQLSNLGQIRWKKDVQNLIVTPATVEFSGIHLDDLSALSMWSSDTLQTYLESTANSWTSAFVPDSSASAFTQRLRPKMSLGISMQAFETESQQGTLGAWVRSSQNGLLDWRLSYNHRLRQWLGLSISWGASQSRTSTIGSAISVNIGRIAVFLASDHIGFSRWSRIQVSKESDDGTAVNDEFLVPNQAHTMQVQLGFNWRFISKKRTLRRQSSPAQSDYSKAFQSSTTRIPKLAGQVHPGSVPCNAPGQWKD